jgi:hypothetical protein
VEKDVGSAVLQRSTPEIEVFLGQVAVIQIECGHADAHGVFVFAPVMSAVEQDESSAHCSHSAFRRFHEDLFDLFYGCQALLLSHDTLEYIHMNEKSSSNGE